MPPVHTRGLCAERGDPGSWADTSVALGLVLAALRGCPDQCTAGAGGSPVPHSPPLGAAVGCSGIGQGTPEVPLAREPPISVPSGLGSLHEAIQVGRPSSSVCPKGTESPSLWRSGAGGAITGLPRRARPHPCAPVIPVLRGEARRRGCGWIQPHHCLPVGLTEPSRQALRGRGADGVGASLVPCTLWPPLGAPPPWDCTLGPPAHAAAISLHRQPLGRPCLLQAHIRGPQPPQAPFCAVPWARSLGGGCMQRVPQGRSRGH